VSKKNRDGELVLLLFRLVVVLGGDPRILLLLLRGSSEKTGSYKKKVKTLLLYFGRIEYHILFVDLVVPAARGTRTGRGKINNTTSLVREDGRQVDVVGSAGHASPIKEQQIDVERHHRREEGRET
jgi:hypothetical protein